MDPREEHAPQRLIEDLRAVFGRDVSVPPEVDEAILARARRRFSRRRPRVLVLRWGAAAAAAACLVLAVNLWGPGGERPAAMEGLAAVAREDFDRNGRVDILDAFALARRIEASERIGREWDLDGNGAVDRGDVDLVAMAAVNLERGAVR